MTRALIQANANLTGMRRGDTAEVEVTDRLIKRAANGQVSILRTWEVDEDQSTLAARVEAGTIDDAVALVDSGEASAVEVLEAEQAGKNRTGLVDALEKRATVDQETAQAADGGDAGVVGSDDGADGAGGD